jgi:hypothetical protein
MGGTQDEHEYFYPLIPFPSIPPSGCWVFIPPPMKNQLPGRIIEGRRGVGKDGSGFMRINRENTLLTFVKTEASKPTFWNR